MTKAHIGDNSDVEISFDDLENILSNLSGKKKSVSEATGTLRNALKTHLEQSGIHPKALATIRAIDDMSPTYRADFMRSFRPMLKVMQAQKWDVEQQDLLDAIEGEADAA